MFVHHNPKFQPLAELEINCNIIVEQTDKHLAVCTF